MTILTFHLGKYKQNEAHRESSFDKRTHAFTICKPLPLPRAAGAGTRAGAKQNQVKLPEQKTFFPRRAVHDHDHAG